MYCWLYNNANSKVLKCWLTKGANLPLLEKKICTILQSKILYWFRIFCHFFYSNLWMVLYEINHIMAKIQTYRRGFGGNARWRNKKGFPKAREVDLILVCIFHIFDIPKTLICNFWYHRIRRSNRFCGRCLYLALFTHIFELWILYAY